MRRALLFLILLGLVLPGLASATVTTTATSVTYTGDGASTSFAIPFVFGAAVDIHLTVATVPKVYNTDYSVAKAIGGAGGTLTTVLAPANGAAVVISRTTPKVQGVHYVPNAAFPASTTEGALDRLTMMTQEQIPGPAGPQGPIGGASPWIDIRSYGASVSASAATNRAAIQAAHDGVPTGVAAHIWIPGGNGCYSIDAAISVTKPITWIGDGPGRLDASTGSCVRLTTATQDGFSVNTSEPVSFKGFSIYSTVASAGACIVLNGPVTGGFSGSQAGEISRMHFRGCWQSVHSINAIFYNVYGNAFLQCADTCMRWENQNNPDQNGPRVFRNVFMDDSKTKTGFVWQSGGGLRLEHNEFLGFLGPVVIDPNTNTSTQELWINDNTLTSFGAGSGILIQRTSGTGTLVYFHIQRNIIASLSIPGHGVGIHFVTNNATYIADVKTTDNFIADVDQGIVVAGGTRHTIDGNEMIRITTGAAIGISIGGASAEVDVGHHRFTNVTTPISGLTTAWVFPGVVNMPVLQLEAPTGKLVGIGVVGTLAADYSLVLPSAVAGSADLCFKSSDALGNTKWTACAAGAGGVTGSFVVRCEAATDKVRTLTYVNGQLTSSGTCA